MTFYFKLLCCLTLLWFNHFIGQFKALSIMNFTTSFLYKKIVFFFLEIRTQATFHLILKDVEIATFLKARPILEVDCSVPISKNVTTDSQNRK
jgi:hypothetical protein